MSDSQYTPMTRLKILLIEDNPGDVYMIKKMLSDCGLTEHGQLVFELLTAEKLSEGIEKLPEGFDIIFLDLGLPDSLGLETFDTLHKRSHSIPVIVMTGLDDTSISIKAVQKGAQDYLVKGHFDANALKRTIRYAIERQKLLIQLEKSMEEIKTLRGILPICSVCKKIRNDKGYWEQLEAYITEHSGVLFSHGYCKECAKKALDDFQKTFKDIKGKDNPGSEEVK